MRDSTFRITAITFRAFLYVRDSMLGLVGCGVGCVMVCDMNGTGM